MPSSIPIRGRHTPDHRIGATGYVCLAAISTRLGSMAKKSLLAVRAELVKRVGGMLAGEPGAAFVLGLVVGASYRFKNSDWGLLKRTGTSYLMAISGLHSGGCRLGFWYCWGAILRG